MSQLLSDPSDATHLVLRSNFGLLTTRDTGQNWDLVCEGGIGYQNIEPPVALLGDGSLIAALSSGIAHGDPSACNFGPASGVSAYVADVSRVPGTPASAVAVSVDPSASSSQVWQSNDGSSWAALGSALSDLSAVTLDVAADDASIVYVSGTTQSAALSGVLARSADGGQTWARYAVPGASKVSAPYIAALSASDHQVVYVRLSGTPGRLLVTRDGGDHFDSALDFTGPFDGFALSPDGQFALASGRIDGVWRAPMSTLAFERLSCAKIRCLSWSESGLFACADEFEAGFLVGQSPDQGASFAPVLHLSCLRGPLSCAPSSTVGAVCAQAWPGISEQLGSDCAAASSFMPSTQCRDAGSAPSDAAPPGSDASPTSDGGQPGPGVTPIRSAALSARGGCACNAARGSSESWPWLSVLALG
ncbi:MAG TPA: hypothetical protein VNW92_12215, partial [Polyangiaceae bacterium]|nr:hypothetical protein [Polyangiaceae bacterium]